jgi:amino acid adenylation domain-containing protein
MDFNVDCSPVLMTMPDNLAYMIYTSGSTGKPKGAMLHQAGLWNFINVIIDMEKLTPADRISGHRSFSFDAHIEDMYPVLTLGGSFHIIPTEIRKDLAAIREFLFEHQITGGGYSTAIAALLLNTYDDLPVRFITAGGEKLDGVYSDHIEIINVYGPTECTCDTSYYKIAPGTRIDNIPIGKSVANNYNFIVDPQGRLLPQGIPGELCFAGIQVGRGYWQLPERTAQAFCDCPFVKNDAYGRPVLMYHTGDLARYNADGQLEYLGRIDFQVKLRGYRIELGEIESRAAQFPGIQQVVAVVYKGQTLCLYYTVFDGKTVENEKLKAFLAETLTDYMVPTAYMQLDDMPLTPNGKVNRKALPEPVIELEEIVAPETETEQQVFDIVSETLKTKEFGVTNNLVSLGLSSLAAMRLSAALQNKLQKQVRMADIMKQPTVRAIASLIDGGESNAEGLQFIHSPYERRELYPLTENQRGLYLDWEMNRETTQYNIPEVYRFAEADADKLVAAVKAAVEAHIYLKTRLTRSEDDVMQQRHDDEPVEVTVTTLDAEPELSYFQQKVRAFDLFEDRLYRFEVINTPSCVYLFMDVHHILYDGLSTSVFMGDVLKSYKGEELMPEKFTAYDFALYEQELANSDTMTEAENRFDLLVSEAEVLHYPDSAKPDDDAYAGVSVTVPAAAIDAFCAANGVTAGSFMQAAFAETMSRLTREQNSLYLTISNGRGASAELISAVGMFVKTLPVVRPNVKRGEQTYDGQRFRDIKTVDYVKAMHEQLRQSYSQDFYPYTRLVERHGIRAEMMFVYQGGLYEGGDIEGIEQTPLSLDTTKFPLTVTVYPENDNYAISIGYDGRRYGKKDMTILAQSIANMAASMANSQHLTDAKTVSETEERQLLALSEGEPLAYNEQETWVDMFQQRAKEHPDHTAVVDSSSRMTFRELDEQSDCLASYLVSKGVQPGDFVAVKMRRVKEFIVAVLGINKAGAAYVPIDPEYPEERIAYMLEDSGAKVVITEEDVKSIRNATLCSAEKMEDDGEYQSSGRWMGNRATPTTPCYMIYTSGSTGKPKGVVLPHRALRAFLAWRIDRLGFNAESRNAVHASFSFDASLDDLLCPIAAGGSVYIVPDDLRKDIDGLYNYLLENRITGMTLTTSLGLLMLGRYHDLPLEYLMMGGEKMLMFPPTPVKVINGYGPTEFCVCSSYHVVNQGKDEDIPIGRPVPNSYTFICDADGNLMPQGAAGELCLSGVQMSMGYWNLPDKTAEVFVDCKFMPGRKMYRTGDLARYNEDGELEYLGRIDNQVKLRGFRVELGEIENRAAQYEGIRQVAAQVWNRQTLCLYYTVSDGKTVERDALKAFLAETLTDYMVPTAYMQLDDMPLTPNGKVNRKALPEPEIKSSAEYVEPEGELEILFANAFANVLHLKQVGALDNFFEIGGTSLNAIRVVGEVFKHGVKIVFNDLFTLKTPRALAAFVAEQAAANPPLDSVASTDDGSSSPSPQSSMSNDISPETGHPYTDYDALLQGNTIDAFRQGERQPLGDILLTGATGFLGMHILHELLKRYTGHIYCPVRVKDGEDPLERLKTVYFYYFDEDQFEKLDHQVTVFTAEITQPDALTVLDGYPIENLTVINCVANVKHFSQGNDIELVNIESVRHLITFCERTHARLIHISTASIAGMSVNGHPSPGVKLTEQSFWLGQKVDGNKYVYSKFTAEDLVLDAILRKGVKAKIMRVGNLSARQTDGEFQINFNSNNTMAMLRAYALLGVAPYEIVNTSIEFSPIDEVAHTILLLSETPDACVVFHPYSVQRHYMYEILKIFEKIGLNVRFVEKEEFMQVVSRAFENPALAELMRPLMAYDMNNGFEMRNIEFENNYTTEVLFRLGYSWPPKELPYFVRNYKALAGLGYFDVN